MQAAALRLMEDIVPQSPASDTLVRVSGEHAHAIWGKIFGDSQIGALVALTREKSKEDDDASLCLLLWQDGWKFKGWAGKVSSSKYPSEWAQVDSLSWDWALKRRTPNGPYYVVSGLDVNRLSYQQHPSWLCDPKTHSLQSTGWPEDAIPSLFGQTITFERCIKSGYAPDVFEIDAFDGKPGKNLAVCTGMYEGSVPLVTVSMPDPTTGKRITWRIMPQNTQFEAGHDRRLLCLSKGDTNLEPFHQDATLDVRWGTESYPNTATHFLVWRLTGLERAAQMGIWEEDEEQETPEWDKWADQKPAQVIVTGIPEAVRAFSWPVNPPQIPDAAKPK
jgi:hypothetical protein